MITKQVIGMILADLCIQIQNAIGDRKLANLEIRSIGL